MKNSQLTAILALVLLITLTANIYVGTKKSDDVTIMTLESSIESPSFKHAFLYNSTVTIKGSDLYFSGVLTDFREKRSVIIDIAGEISDENDSVMFTKDDYSIQNQDDGALNAPLREVYSQVDFNLPIKARMQKLSPTVICVRMEKFISGSGCYRIR